MAKKLHKIRTLKELVDLIHTYIKDLDAQFESNIDEMFNDFHKNIDFSAQNQFQLRTLACRVKDFLDDIAIPAFTRIVEGWDDFEFQKPIMIVLMRRELNCYVKELDRRLLD